MEKEIETKLVQELIDKRVCCSKAEARRLVMCMPEDRLRRRIDRVAVVKQPACNED